VLTHVFVSCYYILTITIIKYLLVLIFLFNIRLENAPVAVFIQEKLQGADILTYLSTKENYSEQTVATIVTQVIIYIFCGLRKLNGTEKKTNNNSENFKWVKFRDLELSSII
jgi:hypothetical protein